MRKRERQTETIVPTLLVIRLHPSEAIEADVFATYLTASRLTPPDTRSVIQQAQMHRRERQVTLRLYRPPTPDSGTYIVEHFDNISNVMFLVATAAIIIPDQFVDGEYETADVRPVIFEVEIKPRMRFDDETIVMPFRFLVYVHGRIGGVVNA